MKDLNEYEAGMRTLLGDENGRRYSENQLKEGLRKALRGLGEFHAYKETLKVKIGKMNGPEAVISWDPAKDGEILSYRNEAGQWLEGVDYRTEGKLYITFYGRSIRPREGDYLLIEMSLCHQIKGLDGAAETTVPDRLAGTVVTGAGGYAMEMRARSVTEVFGKRPEDTDHLQEMSRTLLNEFYEDLISSQCAPVDPHPRGGFEI